MEVSTRNGAEGNFPSLDEEVCLNQESKGTERKQMSLEMEKNSRMERFCRVRAY